LDKWRHLLISGEYADRKSIVSGLTLDQALARPSAGSHSIYEELWHATRWQNIVVGRDEELYGKWERGETYPPLPAADEGEWEALVREFLSGLERAMAWTEPEKLTMEVDPDFTMADVLRSLAVHTSYHMGKIVAIRQVIGAWPAASPANRG
jgi:uncharacterized damage-inducible protein DinB